MPKSAVLFSQGDPANSVFYIQSGGVRLTAVSSSGKEAVVGTLGAGDFFGESCLANQPFRAVTATAIKDSALLELCRDTMLDLVRDERHFSELFVAHLLRRNIRLEADLVDRLFNSSEKRLARALLLMAGFEGDEPREPVIVPKVSHEILAEIVGTTRPRVTFFMNKFRRLGFIDYADGIVIRRALLTVLLSH